MTYEEIIKDQDLAKKLIEDCYFKSTEPVPRWEKARKFISKAFDKPGSVLDIGCANGFLLKSLQFWSKQKLLPYGIDIVEENIIKAKDLFGIHQDNFVATSLGNLLKEYPRSLPNQFDYIYWAYWSNLGEIKKESVDILLSHLKPDGKLIIGFYPEDSKDPSDIIGNIPKLISYEYGVNVIKNDVSDRNEKLAIVNKNT
jgi:SAM-dependent methyltransferase